MTEEIGHDGGVTGDGEDTAQVAVIGPAADVPVDSVALDGVSEVIVVPSPEDRYEAHVWQAAAEALIERRAPAVVLAGFSASPA